MLYATFSTPRLSVFEAYRPILTAIAEFLALAGFFGVVWLYAIAFGA